MNTRTPLVVLALLSLVPACGKRAPSKSDRLSPAIVDREFGRRQGADPADSADGPPAGTPFGLYLLALSWSPNFCCGHENKQECSTLTGSFAATHLTLHGLWPNYTDAESKVARVAYPQFCGDFKRCKNARDGSCAPDPATIPAEMSKLGPGYVTDGYFLAVHEWPKHGSCTGLDAATYFRAGIDAMKRLPGDEGTPAPLRAAVGKSISVAELQGAFGGPPSSVLLGCDRKCRLSQVSVCLGHDAKGLPTTPVACPSNTTTSDYDNGCVTHGCAEVLVQAAGSCDIGKPSKTTPSPGGGGEKCSHPGQGPACTGDASCRQAGFLRCARSGCCTSVP